MLDTLCYVPMSFYDRTPLGRILNRFVKDVYTTDEQLAQTIRSYIGCLVRVGLGKLL